MQWREQLDKLDQAQDRRQCAVLPGESPVAFSRSAGSWQAGLLKENGAGAGSWSKSRSARPGFGQGAQRRPAQNVDEEQIYRIDHYLGKETVQNILVLRFANGMFEPIWNRNHIDHVQITVGEKLGVGQRGKYYEKTGALRDMVPNHLFQLLSLMAMEPPVSFDAACVRDEKAEVLEAIQTQSEAEALQNSVRGQYQAGKVGDAEIAAIAGPRTSSPTAPPKPMSR